MQRGILWNVVTLPQSCPRAVGVGGSSVSRDDGSLKPQGLGDQRGAGDKAEFPGESFGRADGGLPDSL